MTNDQSQAQDTFEPSEQADAETHAAADPVAELEAKLAESEARYLRALADYQNFQRRAASNEVEARSRGVRDVLESLLPVLDNADISLTQDPETLEVQSLLSAVKLLRDGLVQSMVSHGVTTIAPEPGEEFTPGTHEAIMQTPSSELEPGTVAQTLQVGYSIKDRVVRPAKVSVAQAAAEGA